MQTWTCTRSTWSRSPQLQDSELSTRKTVAPDMAIFVGLNLLWSPEMNIDNPLQSSSVDFISNNRVYCSCIAIQQSTSFGWQNWRRVCECASRSLREVPSALYHETTETLQCSYHGYWRTNNSRVSKLWILYMWLTFVNCSWCVVSCVDIDEVTSVSSLCWHSVEIRRL